MRNAIRGVHGQHTFGLLLEDSALTTRCVDKMASPAQTKCKNLSRPIDAFRCSSHASSLFAVVINVSLILMILHRFVYRDLNRKIRAAHRVCLTTKVEFNMSASIASCRQTLHWACLRPSQRYRQCHCCTPSWIQYCCMTGCCTGIESLEAAPADQRL